MAKRASICVMSMDVSVCVFVCTPHAICALCWFTVLGASIHKQGHVFICYTHWRTDRTLRLIFLCMLVGFWIHAAFPYTHTVLIYNSVPSLWPILIYRVPSYYSYTMHHDSNLLHCRVYSSHLDQKRFWNFMPAHNTHKNIYRSGLWTNLGLLNVFETDNVLFYKVVIKLIIHKMVMKGLLSPHHMAILDVIHK